MTLRNRFILVGLGMTVFVLATPVAVLYALGYKVDVNTHQFIKTGSFVAKSQPTRANIFIDDKVQGSRTDATVRFILPGDYNFKIQKDEFQPWTKRLNVRSGIVTWANQDRNFITLFYNTPKPRQETPVSYNAVSVKDNDAILISDGKAYSYDANRAGLRALDSQLPVFDPPAKLPDTLSTYYLLRNQPARIFSSNQISLSQHLESNSNYAAILMAGTLYQTKGQELNLHAKNVSGFALENDNLWFVEGNMLRTSNLSAGITSDVATLPYSPIKATIIRGDSQVFLILDGKLFALNDELEELYNGVEYAYWDSPAKRLVFSNSNEALLFDPVGYKTELIIRSSTPISQPTVNNQTGYLFFINEGKIKAIELDGRDHRNVYTVADVAAESFLLSENGKILSAFTGTAVKSMEITQ